MTVHIQPDTRQRFQTTARNREIKFLARTNDDTIRNEDVPEIGKWKDRTGEGGQRSRNIILNMKPNQFQGEVPGIKGERLGNLNDRGRDTSFFRSRRRLITRDLDGY